MSAKYTTADDPSETKWVQTGQSLLRKGWFVGKKVAVAGAAISVAPVVIPPLLMFSAFGLALSVPFGVYYAGVVGTERIMQSLLPLDQGQEVAEGNQEEGDKIVEEEEYIGERDFESEENWDRNGDEEMVVQREGYVRMWGSKTEGNGGEAKDRDTMLEDPGERDGFTEEYGEMNKDNGSARNFHERDEMVENRKGHDVIKRGLKPEKEGKLEDDVDVETATVKVDVVEETGRMNRDDTREETENDQVTVESIIDITSATVDEDSVTLVKIEMKPDEDNSTTMTEEGTGIAGAEPIQVEKGNTDVLGDKGTVIADTDGNVAKK